MTTLYAAAVGRSTWSWGLFLVLLICAWHGAEMNPLPATEHESIDRAPNVVLGGSRSGNVFAAGLAAEGLLGILSSDYYYPASLLQAAFALAVLDNHCDRP